MGLKRLVKRGSVSHQSCGSWGSLALGPGWLGWLGWFRRRARGGWPGARACWAIGSGVDVGRVGLVLAHHVDELGGEERQADRRIAAQLFYRFLEENISSAVLRFRARGDRAPWGR